MRTLIVSTIAAAVVATTFAGPPAHAEHTLCDNEPSDIAPVADLNSPGAVYICVGTALIVIRTDRVGVTFCTYHHSSGVGNVCPIVT